jgi:hypothetical protein
MKKYIAGILFISILSCNPVGEDLAEVPLVFDEITSLKGLDLKKGEEVVFWSKVSTSEFSYHKIKYSIALNNKIVTIDTTSLMLGEHTINSKVSQDGGFISNLFTGNNSSSIEFERENISFKVPEDGKYDFDFKISSNENSSSFGEKFSFILRKK